jgi:uncharacterized protein
MDSNSFNEVANNKNMRLGILILVSIASVFLFAMTINEIKQLGSAADSIPSHTITVSGEGEVFAVATMATFTYSVVEDANTVAEAQTKATTKSNAIIDYLKNNAIAEKDIKTVAYNVYPKYEYTQPACRAGICPPGRQAITGYEVNQTVEVKVRDTQRAGDLLTGVGGRGASNISGIHFTIDDDDVLIQQAREKAIADARENAKVLTKSLGVRLGKVVTFSENGGGYPPMPYAKTMMVDGRGGAEAAVAPDLPQGENRIVSYVTVTYEIR